RRGADAAPRRRPTARPRGPTRRSASAVGPGAGAGVKGLGRAALVGAGPGDPGLLTVRGRRLLRRADIVVYDRLVDKRLLELVPARARRVFVGKASEIGRAHV